MKNETIESFYADADKQDAVMYRLGQIGETADYRPLREGDYCGCGIWD